MIDGDREQSGAGANAALAALSEAAALTNASDAHAASLRQSWLVLRSGTRWLAIPADSVREVVLKNFITRVPHAPPQMLGVILIRGRLVPVLSLEGLLRCGAADVAAPTLPRLVVLAGKHSEAAIVADEVRGIVELADISTQNQAGPGTRPGFVRAEISWEKRLLCILDPQQLLAATLGEAESP